jgi:monovalent cation:H+ antiporter-2, CPA2 family
MSENAVSDVLVLLALSVVAVAFLRRVHLPPILGYLFVGVIAGPHALGWIAESEAIHLLGEAGVVFLLFMIGLEISIPQLLSMRHAVLGFGGAQVGLTTLIVMAIAWSSGIRWEGALVVGGALALSSTAIVARQLTEQLELQSRHGRLALGILLFQDLAVVPFLVVIPILGGQAESGIVAALGVALVKGIAVIIGMLAVGRWVLRPLFHWVASAHSVELFTLAVLLVALASSSITHSVGLSAELGAFIAGMLIGDTEYRHHVELETRPFRDVLMGLFFITVGMQLDLFALPTTLHWVILLVAGVVIGKGLLITAVLRIGGNESGVALRTGLVLAQGGEFGFALLALAMGYGLLTAEDNQPVIAAVVLSMVIAPILVRRNGDIAKRVCRSYLQSREAQAHHLTEEASHLEDHVILCGFGRIGQNLALFLKKEDIPYVALDVDSVLIRDAWEAGEPAFFGNATHPEILETAGIDRALALVVSFDEFHTAERIIQTARVLRDDIPIVVRASDDAHLEALEEAGATHVVPESVESSLMLATRLLHSLAVDTDEIAQVVEQARTDHYRRLRGYFHGEAIEDMDELNRYRLHTVVLPSEAYAVGQPIAALALGTLGVQVVTVRRAGICGDEPDPKMVLRGGDALILQGTQDTLDAAEARLLGESGI